MKTVTLSKRLAGFVMGVACCAGQVAVSDEVIGENVIITSLAGGGGSLCVGADCVDGEEFDFDVIRLKSPFPLMQFLDTSNSGSFPSNDWSMGIGNSGAGSAPQFFLKDDSNDTVLLLLEAGAGGGVAIGAGAALEPGAISVGDEGAERRVVFVADGIESTDAATKGQLDAYITGIGGDASSQLASERAALDGEIADLRAEFADLLTRFGALESALEE
jgi:hypothetical protein